ncbi:hypothetical protein KPH14_001780 [Odynerus spinipes]|uniref:Ribosomal protein L1 n=1 Tax=Odynerus spinipes TaxID=1348599 RepID=A0AAD9RZS7_9HYME|nr:hypothetical protein KPH14_001780 [Odynerus spinipes]
MKLSKNVTKNKKTLNKHVSKTSKEDEKVKLKSKSIENGKTGKYGLAKNKKKVKSIKRLKDAEISDTTIVVGKENKKVLKKGGKNEKKKIVNVTAEKTKVSVQVSNQISEEEKEENTRIKNSIQKENLKRKSPSNTKKSKKLKSDSDASTKKQHTVDKKSASKKKMLKKKVESKEEENGDGNLKDISREHILNCISAIFHLTEEQLKNKKDLFSGEPQPIFMQVTCIRVPKVPRRRVKMVLPHSIILPDDDIALFVCDLERGRKKDYEPTVDHYRELLDECGCTRIKDIIPMKQVKTEYDQYELKRKLAGSYDHFLVDGRISGHMTHLLGKIFDRKRKLPISIRMDSKDLKSEIDYALRKTSMTLHSLADTHIVQVANTSMKKDDILENVIAVCRNLGQTYPGGWSNIRAIRLKARTGPGLVLYMTLKNKNTVDTPCVKPKRPKAYRNVEGELTTLSGDATVTVTPEGDVIVKQTFPKESEDSEDKENIEKE